MRRLKYCDKCLVFFPSDIEAPCKCRPKRPSHDELQAYWNQMQQYIQQMEVAQPRQQYIVMSRGQLDAYNQLLQADRGQYIAWDIEAGGQR